MSSPVGLLLEMAKLLLLQIMT